MTTSRSVPWAPAMAACVMIGAVGPTTAAGGAALTPLSQARSVSGFVIVPPCGPPTTTSDSEQATDLGPFKADVLVQKICSMALAVAQASQQSQIDASSISAVGASSATALSKVGTVIHSLPGSNFKVVFSIDAPARVVVGAQLSAAGVLPIVASRATIRLGPGPGDPVSDPFTAIVEHSVQAAAASGGAPVRASVEQQVVLQPGTYNLRAEAISWIDAMVPPNGSGDASYDLTLTLLDVADLDADGDVDGVDLALLLGGWGGCPLACPACCCLTDLNCDGLTNGLDVALLLGAWNP